MGSSIEPTATIVSPACSPASCAGDTAPFSVGSTAEITTVRAPLGSPLPKKNSPIAKMTAAITKWEPGPAKIVSARCQIGLAPKVRGMSSGGTSSKGFMPSIFT